MTPPCSTFPGAAISRTVLGPFRSVQPLDLLAPRRRSRMLTVPSVVEEGADPGAEPGAVAFVSLHRGDRAVR